MKYLWIGIEISDGMKKRILSSGGHLMSGYISEQALIEGLDTFHIDMDSINSFPQIAQSVMYRIPEEKWSRNGSSEDCSIGFTNRKYICNLERTLKLKAAAKNWALRHRQDDVTVFTFCMHSPFMAAAAEIKRLIPSATIVQIVPDLPQYMDLAMSKIKKILKKIDWQRIKKYMKSVNRYVLYAKPMAEYLGLKDGQWTVMEGAYDPELLPEKVEKDAGIVSIMYSGVIDMRYGIPELLDAMKLLPDNYELWLTGSGNAVELVKERAKTDSRIRFFGFLPSRQDLLNKQAQATMLISPRKDTEDASKYCFPSKLFEYMISGNPVISCRLDGIPDEYFDYLIELPTVTAESISKTILKTAEQYAALHQSNAEHPGKRFILEKKNKVEQAKKLLGTVE